MIRHIRYNRENTKENLIAFCLKDRGKEKSCSSRKINECYMRSSQCVAVCSQPWHQSASSSLLLKLWCYISGWQCGRFVFALLPLAAPSYTLSLIYMLDCGHSLIIPILISATVNEWRDSSRGVWTFGLMWVLQRGSLGIAQTLTVHYCGYMTF